MESLHKLKKMMCRELDEISNKGDMSAGDLEAVHKLTDTIKNIDKIMYLEGGSEYSRGGDWDTSGRYSRGRYPDIDYDDYSNARRGQHYVRVHYSYNDAKMQVKETIKDMMHDSNLSSTDQAALGRALAELDR